MNTKFLTTIFFAFAFVGVTLAQDGDDYAREIKKRVLKGEISTADIEAKLRSGEITRIGGVYINPKASVIDNLARSRQHVTLSEAIVGTSLKEQLNGGKENTDTFTIFAPYDESFGELPEGMLAEITAEGNEEQLKDFAGNHVVKGTYTIEKIMKAIEDGKGRGEVYTLSGMRLYFFTRGSKLVVVDERGNKGTIRVKDCITANGVIQGIDAVLLKK